jgi:hypothetical protein
MFATNMVHLQLTAYSGRIKTSKSVTALLPKVAASVVSADAGRLKLLK